MSTYESNPAGLGVGKRYGAKGIGGTVGEYAHNDSSRELIFEIKAGEPLDAATLTKSLPAGYLVNDVKYEVTEVFLGTTPGFTCAIGGGTASTEDQLAALAPAASWTVGSATNLSSTTAKDFVVTLDAAALASATGKATIVVQYSVI
jgi:hypothetical protein